MLSPKPSVSEAVSEQHLNAFLRIGARSSLNLTDQRPMGVHGPEASTIKG